MRAEILAREKLDRMRRDDRQRQFAGERDGGGDQRVVIGVPGALHFEVIALWKPGRPLARRARRADGIALQQRAWPTSLARAG